MPWMVERHNISIDDLQLLDLSGADEAYAPSTPPAGAVWPRATVRFRNGRWAVKVWQSPVVPARRQGLLLAGMYFDRDDAFKFARYEVGLLRFTDRNRTLVAPVNHRCISPGELQGLQAEPGRPKAGPSC